LILGALMTAFYMSRVYLLTFWGKFRGTKEQEHHLHESPLSMTIPLMVLAALAVGGGFFVTGYVEHNLAGMLKDAHGVENHALHTIMWGVTAACLAVAGYAYMMYVSKEKQLQTDAQMAGFTKTVYNKYYVDEIYNSLITKPIDAVSRFLVLDGVVNFFGYTTHWLSSTLRRTQTGNVDAYFFAMVISIIIILLFKVF
jgi:NADH-quinone oxidoreductase subunit L